MKIISIYEMSVFVCDVNVCDDVHLRTPSAACLGVQVPNSLGSS